MLPNEIIDKIFKYRHQNFKKFLYKMKKINLEYKEKFMKIEDGSICYRNNDKYGYQFRYNFRYLNISQGRKICNPRVRDENGMLYAIANASKNY